MQTVAAPARVRDQAFGLCRAHGFGALGRIRTSEAGDAVCALLVDLEVFFRIGLDPDELWPEARVADLVALVERKVSDKARLALLPANDDERGVPLAFQARLPIFPPSNARQLRDRARRARRQRFAREIDIVTRLGLGGAFVGGVSALGLGVASLFGWA